MRANILITTGKTLDTLPRPVAKRFVSPEESNPEDLTIEGILQASLPSGTTVSVPHLPSNPDLHFISLQNKDILIKIA